MDKKQELPAASGITRRRMGQLAFAAATGSLASPAIITRGWIHAPEAEELLEEASMVVRAALEKALSDGAVDQETLRRHARKALGKLVGERTRRRPMIVPVVVIV